MVGYQDWRDKVHFMKGTILSKYCDIIHPYLILQSLLLLHQLFHLLHRLLEVKL